VILLMFGVGLHFSLKDLMAVKSIAIPGAIAQIAVATLLGMALSAALGWSLMTGIVFGLCLSTASTVVLLRALEERQLIDSQRGQIAIGWLIVEDLVMVLTLVLLPAVAGMAEKGNVGFASLALDLGITIGKVVAFIAIMMLVGRRLVPWIMSRSAPPARASCSPCRCWPWRWASPSAPWSCLMSPSPSAPSLPAWCLTNPS
jgi:CPA2 family monovalent cation:H+ antiporter-2